jgi:hypothetical protein
MRHIGTRVARLGGSPEDDDWFTFCGELVEACEISWDPDCPECIELALDETDET